MPSVMIEKHIPIPGHDTLPGRGTPAKYPFAKMDLGESFWLLGKAGDKAAQAAIKYAQRHPGLRFLTRKLEGGCRIWRIE